MPPGDPLTNRSIVPSPSKSPGSSDSGENPSASGITPTSPMSALMVETGRSPDFVRLRHYGLLAACNATTLLEVARAHLGQPPPPPVDDLTWRERLFRLTGLDLRVCSRCHTCSVERVAHFAPQRPELEPVEALDSS